MHRGPLAVLLSHDRTFLRSAGECLSGAGFRVAHFSFVEAAVEFIRNSEVAVAVVDAAGEGRDGAPALSGRISSADSELPVVVANVTGLVDSVTRAMARAGRRQSAPAGAATVQPAPMIGQSPQVSYLREYIARISACDSNVLITGETGTGRNWRRL